MPLAEVDSPFALEDIEDIALGGTPLVSVLFQVRFPHPVTRVQQALDAKEFQRQLADAYPYAEEQEGMQVLLVPGQAPSVQPGPKAWTWRTADQRRTASITQEAVSLTVDDYTSRADFVTAAGELLELVGEVAHIPQSARIGIRYLNRVVEDGTLRAWVPTLANGARGILADLSASDEGIRHSFSQVVYAFSDQRTLQAKWGLLAPNAVMDPSMGPVDKTSWVLDIDCFEEVVRDYNAKEISTTLETLAKRSYRFFRWVVTPESLMRFEPQEVL